MSCSKFKSERGKYTGGGAYSLNFILESENENGPHPFFLVKMKGSPVFSSGFIPTFPVYIIKKINNK